MDRRPDLPGYCFSHEREEPTPRSSSQIRPRSESPIPVDDLVIGQQVLVNFNMEEGKERGLWYDAKIAAKEVLSRTKKAVTVTLILGEECETEVNDCNVHFIKEILTITKVERGKWNQSNGGKVKSVQRGKVK